MTDLQPPPVPVRQLPVAQQGPPDNDLILPLIGWGTYLVGWGLIGLVIAYVDRKNAPPFVRGNYSYMIRTFWIGCLYFLLGLLLAGLFFLSSAVIHTVGLVLAGIALWGLPVLTAIWFIVRCVKGIIWLVRRQELDAPKTWLV